MIEKRKQHTAHYIRRYYKLMDCSGIIDTFESKTENRDPLAVKIYPGMVGFSYFDVVKTEKDGDQTVYEKNMSPIYWLGERKSAREVIEENAQRVCLLNPFERDENLDKIHFCEIYGSLYRMDEDDITISEVRENALVKDRDVLIERGTFFKVIAKILSVTERDDFDYEETHDVKYIGREANGEVCKTRVSRSLYSITLGGKPLICHRKYCEIMLTLNGQKVIFEDLDAQTNLEELKTEIAELVRIYPYLEEFILKIKDMCLVHEGEIDERAILSMAEEYCNPRLKGKSLNLEKLGNN